MRRWLVAIFAVVLLILPGSAAQADPDFTISISDISIDVNGTGYLDVMIRSTGGANSDQVRALGVAGYSFAITTVDPINVHNTLQFVSQQPNAYEYNSQYVFYNTSDNVLNSGIGTNGNVTSSATGVNDLYNGGDSNYDLNAIGGPFVDRNVPLAGVLLIRLQLVSTALDNLGLVGDQFKVALVPLQNNTTPSSTVFQTYDQSTNTAPDPTASSYTSNEATVTIRLRAVPEPGSFALLAIGGLAGGWIVRRRAVRGGSC